MHTSKQRVALFSGLVPVAFHTAPVLGCWPRDGSMSMIGRSLAHYNTTEKNVVVGPGGDAEGVSNDLVFAGQCSQKGIGGWDIFEMTSCSASYMFH